MKRLFTVLIICLPLLSVAQETWNRVYAFQTTDSLEAYGSVEPCGMFLTESHILVFNESVECYNCEHQRQVLFTQHNYDGAVIDTLRYSDEDSTDVWLGGASYYQSTFQNSLGEQVGIIYDFPLGQNQVETFNNSLITFNNDIQPSELIPLDQLSNSNNDNRYFRVEDLEEKGENYLLSGQSMPKESPVIDSVDAFLTAIDPTTGDSIWHRTYPEYFSIKRILIEDTNNIWAVAINLNALPPNESYPNSDYALIKLDSEGNILESIEFGGPYIEGFSYSASIHLIHEGDRILVGGFLSNDEFINIPGSGTYFASVFQETENGIEEVDRNRYGVNHNTQEVNGFFQVESDSSYILFGKYSTPEPPYHRGFVLNVDHNLDSLWSRRYTYYNNDQSEHSLRYFKPIPNQDGYIGCGYVTNDTDDPFPYLNQLWLFRTDEYGCLEPGCQDVNVEEITIGLENVMSVYPNPARDRVTVKFDFPKNYSPPNSGEFRLMSTDGREVLRKEVDTNSFSSSMKLDVSSLQSGVYILHWTDGKRWFDSVRVIVK